MLVPINHLGVYPGIVLALVMIHDAVFIASLTSLSSTHEHKVNKKKAPRKNPIQREESQTYVSAIVPLVPTHLSTDTFLALP